MPRLPLLLALLAAPLPAAAQCFGSLGSELWPNHEVVYEIDRTATTRAWQTECLEAEFVESFVDAEADGLSTIEDYLLDGLQDWIYGDPDLEQPLTFRERVGDEEPYILVTSICELDGSSFSNQVSVSSELPGHEGDATYFINLRPKRVDSDRFRETVRHELGHALGMQHAHQRPDRDSYLDVHDLAGGAFDIWSIGQCKNALYNLPFDYSSIMIYEPRPVSGGLVCDEDHLENCEMVPVDDPDLAKFHAMQERTITDADRWAVRLHYSWQTPDNVGLYNPQTGAWALAEPSRSTTDGNAYAFDKIAAFPGRSFFWRNGVFDRDISTGSAVMVTGDWTDPVEDGFDHLGVAWLERAGRAYEVRLQRDLDEDLWGEDEEPVSVAVDGERRIVVGDWDGDPTTPPGLGLYDPDSDSFTYDLDADGELDSELFDFFAPGLSAWPVAADLQGNGFDSLCLFLQDWGAFVCDMDGDDVADWGSFFTARTGASVYPVVGDWNGDGVDDLGIYDAAERVFELDRNDDYTISPLQGVGLSMDLIFEPANSGETEPGDVSLVPFAGQLDTDAMVKEYSLQPWEGEWCDVIEGESICEDPWVACTALSEVPNSGASGLVCVDFLEDVYDEVPDNCMWDMAYLHCW